jgi:O-antigen/teichoic acid export membrane protein
MRYKSLVRDAFAYTFAGYLIQPLTLISSLWIKGIIGPYLVGVLATLTLVMSYSGFSNLGTLSAAERDLPVLIGANKPERFNRMRTTVFTLTMVSGVVFAMLMLASAFIYRRTLDPALFEGLIIYAVVVILQQWSFYYITLLRTHQEFVFLSKIQVLAGVLSSFGNVLAALFFGFRGLLVSTMLVSMLQVAIFSQHKRQPVALGLDRQEMKHLLSVGVPLLAFGLVMTGMKTIDNIMVLRLLGTEALGLYSIALMANVVLFSLTNSLSGVLYPRMQAAYGRSRTLESLSAYVIRPTLIMGVCLPILVALIFFSVPFIVQAFLPRFIPGLPAFRVIVSVTYFFAMFQMSSAFLIALNKQIKVMLLLGAALVVTVLLSLVFTDWNWGLVGIASAVGVGYGLCFTIVNSYAVRHWAGWRQVARFLWDAALPFLYSAILLVLLEVVLPIDPSNLVLAAGLTALKFVLFCIGYIPLVVIMERRTGLWTDFGSPLLRSLRGQFTAFHQRNKQD